MQRKQETHVRVNWCQQTSATLLSKRFQFLGECLYINCANFRLNIRTILSIKPQYERKGLRRSTIAHIGDSITRMKYVKIQIQHRFTNSQKGLLARNFSLNHQTSWIFQTANDRELLADSKVLFSPLLEISLDYT